MARVEVDWLVIVILSNAIAYSYNKEVLYWITEEDGKEEGVIRDDHGTHMD